MNISTTVTELKPMKMHPLAVVLHLYYTELFVEVLTYLDNLDDAFDLYLSIDEDNWHSQNVSSQNIPVQRF